MRWDGPSVEVEMTDWVNETFNMPLLRNIRDGENGLRVGLGNHNVWIAWGNAYEEGSLINFRPLTKKEANQLSMVFRKVSKRLEMMAQGLE